MRNHILCPAVVAALLLVSGLGTASGWAQSLQPNIWLRISAFTDQPLAGADVAIFSPDGRLLLEKANATNAEHLSSEAQSPAEGFSGGRGLGPEWAS